MSLSWLSSFLLAWPLGSPQVLLTNTKEEEEEEKKVISATSRFASRKVADLFKSNE